MKNRQEQHNEKLRDTYIRRLQKLEEQEALLGPHTTPAVLIEIDDLRAKLHEIETQRIQQDTLDHNADGKQVHRQYIMVIYVVSAVLAVIAVTAVIWQFHQPNSHITLPIVITSPPNTSLALEQQLQRINIVLTDDTPQDTERVRQYLTKPEYRILAVTCINLLRSNRLRRPLQLDTIDGWYRIIVNGTVSIEAENPNDPLVLRDAIIKHWNERYGENITKFEDIIESQP